MLTKDEFLLAAQDLFGTNNFTTIGTWAKPILCDLANQQRPANMGDVLYYGRLRAYVQVDANNPTVGSCSLFLGGEQNLSEGLSQGESSPTYNVIFTDWELDNCRAFFDGYVIEKPKEIVAPVVE